MVGKRKRGRLQGREKKGAWEEKERRESCRVEKKKEKISAWSEKEREESCPPGRTKEKISCVSEKLSLQPFAPVSPPTALQALSRLHEGGVTRPAARAALLPPGLGHLRQERQHQGHLLEPQQHPGKQGTARGPAARDSCPTAATRCRSRLTCLWVCGLLGGLEGRKGRKRTHRENMHCCFSRDLPGGHPLLVMYLGVQGTSSEERVRNTHVHVHARTPPPPTHTHTHTCALLVTCTYTRTHTHTHTHTEIACTHRDKSHALLFLAWLAPPCTIVFLVSRPTTIPCWSYTCGCTDLQGTSNEERSATHAHTLSLSRTLIHTHTHTT